MIWCGTPKYSKIVEVVPVYTDKNRLCTLYDMTDFTKSYCGFNVYAMSFVIHKLVLRPNCEQMDNDSCD